MALATSATIRGKSYSKGTGFTAAASVYGKGSSDGGGNSSYVEKGGSFCFLYYNAGATYPYAIGTGSSTTVRCWVKEDAFPYATYAVSFNANGGSGAPSSQTKTYGTTLTLSTTEPTRTGYTFKSWNTKADGTGTTYAAGGSYTGNAALTLYAIWTANTYSVKFNANGGSGSMSNQSHTYGSSKALTANAFTRAGYTFAGWATSASGSVKYTNSQSVSNLTSTAGGTVNLYAVWTANTYKVKFNANGGSGTMADQSHTYATSKALTSNAFTRTGYTFAGWATTATGAVVYTNGQSVKNLTTTAGGTVNLYAVWTAHTYTVKYNANGGTGTMSDQAFTYGTSQKLTTNGFTRAGHTFLGWSTKSSATTATYTNAQSVSNLTATNNGTVTLYAVWSINTITIGFDATTNGGTVTPTSMKINWGTKINPLPVASRPYYVFLGWYTAPTGGTKITTSTVFKSGQTLYAQFVIDASVHLNVNGTYKKGIPYVKVGGVWKKGYAWIKKNGSWKQGVG